MVELKLRLSLLLGISVTFLSWTHDGGCLLEQHAYPKTITKIDNIINSGTFLAS